MQIRRQGGFCGLDVWVALFVFFTTGASSGFKTFWEVARPHALRLAALAGRRALASPPSLSRALEAGEHGLLRPAGPWLLRGLAEVDEVLRHPAVQTYVRLSTTYHQQAPDRCPERRPARCEVPPQRSVVCHLTQRAAA